MQNIKKISDRISKKLQDELELKRNEAIRDELVGIILAVTGWQSLDTFVEDAINKIISGKPIDFKQFMIDLEEWKSTNLQGGE